MQFRDGKIWRDARYYAEPFDAPMARTVVEHMAEGAAPGEAAS